MDALAVPGLVLGCWECHQASEACRVNFEPSEAPLLTADDAPVSGYMTTFALGFLAFQVFTVDYLEAEQHGANIWNTRVPQHLDQALIRIWPPLGRALAYRDWRQMVTWEGRLRPASDTSWPAGPDRKAR
jgi:hypothetical protein